MRDLTPGGVDFALEFAGVTAALDNAWKMTRRGGVTITAGLPGQQATLGVTIVGLDAEERTLKGRYVGGCVPLRDIPRYINLHQPGRLPVERLLSGKIKLDDINAGFNRLH